MQQKNFSTFINPKQIIYKFPKFGYTDKHSKNIIYQLNISLSIILYKAVQSMEKSLQIKNPKQPLEMATKAHSFSYDAVYTLNHNTVFKIRTKHIEQPQRSIRTASDIQLKRNNLYNKIIKPIIIYSLLFCSLSSGILFIIGSAVYWPTLTDIPPATGGILFIIGSACFLFVDIFAIILQPGIAPWRPFRSVEGMRTLLTMLGSISFIVGSVYFLPDFDQIIGDDIFIVGSAFFWVPQIISCFGILVCNSFTAQYYFKYAPYRTTVLLMNLQTFFGCLFFVVGTFEFKNQPEEKPIYYQEGVIMFIVGSALFLGSSIVGLNMRRNRLQDPLMDFHREVQRNLIGY